jgi:hypothetical protein
MSSPNTNTRLVIRIPGGLMSTPNRLGTRSSFFTQQGIPGQQTTPGNKENSPVASLSGGDTVQQRRAAALHRQAIMSPEIQGLEVPKTINDVFYGSIINFAYIF